MSGIKLTYFNLKGRAELARLILAQAEVEYEDCRIEREEWPELKKTLALGQLPVLEVEGQTIGQSMTIARYLARRFGLAGKTDVDAAEADQAVDALNDLINNVGPIMREKDEEKKEELKKKLQTETMPSWMKMMEALLTSKGGNHFAGKQLTWADIAIYHSVDMFKGMLGEPNMEECPNLQKLMETVKSLPNIKKWEEARPNTPF
eukprot:TRINITY_DN1915_c0_g1_i2.p1 TRINITY_DN1915_c0_g1~~TRINITY_DN1915_c0_g1_i2.p1  ORF type:complete len:224 (-),score=88.34 TRINITY_DN1915_c0_g1_i2:119-733(-)